MDPMKDWNLESFLLHYKISEEIDVLRNLYALPYESLVTTILAWIFSRHTILVFTVQYLLYKLAFQRYYSPAREDLTMAVWSNAAIVLISNQERMPTVLHQHPSVTVHPTCLRLPDSLILGRMCSHL